MTSSSASAPTSSSSSARFCGIVALGLAVTLLASACGEDASTGGGDAAGNQDSDTDTADTDTADTDTAGTDTDTADTDTADTDTADTDTVAEERTASFAGITEDTIQIAVSYLDFAKLVELNLSPNDWGDQELVYQTLLDDINANGGINGRMIEVLTYESYSPIDRDEADAKCVAMTQDNEPFLVLGGFLGPTDTLNACIVTLNETALVGGALVPDLVEDAIAPWWDFRPSEADQAAAFFQLLDQTGRTDDTQAFIVTLTGAEGLADNAVIPKMNELGISIVGEAILDVPDGDQPAQDQRMQVISEQIRESGANTIIIPGGVSAIIRGLSNAGTAGDFEIWAVDRDGLVNLGESVDREDARGVLTIDRLTQAEAWEDPLMSECRTVFTTANPELASEVKHPDDVAEGDSAWFQSIHSYCSRTALMVKLLTAAGVNPTYESLRAGADALGQFSLPGVPNASLSPGKLGADDSFRLSEFDPDEGEKGGTIPLTDILDATP